MTIAEQYLRSSDRKRLEKWNISESRQAVHFIDTADGWQLALSQYTKPEQRRADLPYPVLLCHGLGSNRLAYDIDAEHSLALWLVEQGYDVYSIDLRGHGLSEKPGQKGKKWGWGFNEYCDYDIPAVIDAVLRLSGAEKLHYIGHSMGGILLYSHMAITEQPNIKSGITLASTLDYSQQKTIFKALIKLTGLCHLTPSVPLHFPALFSSWASKFSRKFIDPVLVYPPNVETETFRKMAANVMHPVSSKVLIEMAQAINGNGLKGSDGKLYSDHLKRRGYSCPVLAVSGEGDTQCSPEASALYGTDHKVFGKQHGHQEDYGHDDLMMGRHAREEVWPEIKSWLAKHDD